MADCVLAVHRIRRAGAGWFDETYDSGRGDRRVDCIPALLEDTYASLGRQKLTGGHHAVARHDLRARLPKVTFSAIARNRFAEWRLRRRVARFDLCERS